MPTAVPMTIATMLASDADQQADAGRPDVGHEQVAPGPVGAEVVLQRRVAAAA